MHIGYKKYDKVLEDFEQEQKASQDRFLEQFSALARREKGAIWNIEFTLSYALHKYLVGLEWAGIDSNSHPIPYSTLEAVCINRDLDIERFATRVDEDTPLGGFLRAWLACEGNPGYGPVAFKFLVEDGWMKKINEAYQENHPHQTRITPSEEVQAQVSALEDLCNLLCSKDLRQLRYALGFNVYNTNSPDILKQFEAIT